MYNRSVRWLGRSEAGEGSAAGTEKLAWLWRLQKLAAIEVDHPRTHRATVRNIRWSMRL